MGSWAGITAAGRAAAGRVRAVALLATFVAAGGPLAACAGWHRGGSGPAEKGRSGRGGAHAPDDEVREMAKGLRGRFRPFGAGGDVVGALGTEIEDECRGGGELHDVVLLFDTTGSMDGVVKEGARIGPAVRTAAARGCRFAVLEYRDHGDEFVVAVRASLTEGPDAVAAALDGLSAGGGGDWPEALWEALDVATHLAEKGGRYARVVVVTDAPSHRHPAAEARVRARLARGRIALTFLHSGRSDDDLDAIEEVPRPGKLAGGAPPGDPSLPAPAGDPGLPAPASGPAGAPPAGAGLVAPASGLPLEHAARLLGADFVLAPDVAEASTEAREWLALAAAGGRAARLDVLVLVDRALPALSSAFDPGGTAPPVREALVAPGVTGAAGLRVLLDRLRLAGARTSVVSIAPRLPADEWRVIAPLESASLPAKAPAKGPGSGREVWSLLARAAAETPWLPDRTPVCVLLVEAAPVASEDEAVARVRAWASATGARLLVAGVGGGRAGTGAGGPGRGAP